LFPFCSQNADIRVEDRGEISMSLDVKVFFKGKLPSKAALARSFKELGFPLTFQPRTGALEKHDFGYLPMRFRREESGIEFYTHDSREELEEDFEVAIDPRFTRAATFHWSFDPDEGVVALCFAAALAKLTNGMVLDVDGETMLTVDEAIARARHELTVSTPPAKQRAARPADLRHYLKPLLQQRSDLALVGRMLIIRPVRHLLRGAFFDRTSNRYEFRVWRYIVPLYDAAPDELGYSGETHPDAYEVWQPHFVPLLMDILEEDVFARLGKISSLSDFATQQIGERSAFEAGLTSLFLSGASERADEYLARLPPHWRRDEDVQRIFYRLREQFLHEPERTIADFHAKEAAAVKALKVGHLWDPAPFAVEASSGERAKAHEPVFLTTPWPHRPAWLWQELPEDTGEVRYAKDFRYRDDRIRLLVALTPEEAEERHRERERYVLAARLSDGHLALIIRSTIYDRHTPGDRGSSADPPCITIWLHGQAHFALTSIRDSNRETGVCHIIRFDVRDRATSRVWDCRLNLGKGTKDVWDNGSGKRIYTASALTDAERKAAACPIPAFGEYAAAVECFRLVLRAAGFGDVS
jgi:hypothetical protein